MANNGWSSWVGRRIYSGAASEMEMQQMNPHDISQNDNEEGRLGYRRCQPCPTSPAGWCLKVMEVVGGLIAFGAVVSGIHGMTRRSVAVSHPCQTDNNTLNQSIEGNWTNIANFTEGNYTCSPQEFMEPMVFNDTDFGFATGSDTVRGQQRAARRSARSSNSSSTTTASLNSTVPKALEPFRFASEANYTSDMQTLVEPIWNCRKDGTVTVQAGHGSNLGCVRLRTVSMKQPNVTTCKGDVLIVQGRGDATAKYAETMADFHRQGYNVYSYDHRGQGSSSSLLQNPQLGYIQNFSDYSTDLNKVVNAMGLGNSTRPFHIVGHSMGGAIVCEWLESNPTANVTSATLTSPMMDIKMGFIARLGLWFSGTWVGGGIFNPEAYAPGKGNYTDPPFIGNPNTNCEARYDWWRQAKNRTGFKPGGPSMGWVQQAMQGGARCLHNAGDITVPLLLLQAENDTQVDNAAHGRFWDKAGTKHTENKMIIIQNAKHELFGEKDGPRNQTMQEIFKFHEQTTNVGTSSRLARRNAQRSTKK